LRAEREDAFVTRGTVMKSSNLALRMDGPGGAEQAAETARSDAAVRVTARHLAARFEIRAFEHRPFGQRAFEQRSIVLRDQDLPPFRVR